MKYIEEIYSKINCANADQVFDYLISTLASSIKDWDYFVNWKKVLENYNKIKPELNLLNSLIGETDIEKVALELFTKYPEIIKTIPILLASRDAKQELMLSNNEKIEYHNFDFNNKSLEPAQAVRFMKESGIFALFSDKTIKSMPDYVIGVETGLDSNARKNRTGTGMEKIVQSFIASLCQNNNWQYIAQADKKKIFH